MKNNTQKLVIASITAIIGALMFVAPVLAATTATLSPATVNVTAGRQFSIAVSVNPQGTANYAEKIEINYPASILEVKSFTLGNNWMALTQPGYDSTDNINGILIRTAGYPAGLSSATAFGTVTFYAKKSGNGTIKIGSNSLAFQASAQSTVIGNAIVFTVTAPVVAPKPSTIVENTPVTLETEQAVVEESALSTEPTNQVEPISQVAAVSTAVPQGNGNTWIWILVVITILAIIGWGIYVSRKNREN
ncbi:MAG: cohesin domain-containing protein [Patescibacteria group bacterium]